MSIKNILFITATTLPLTAFAQEAAEQSEGVIEFVKSASQFLPFPWNVVAVSVATAAGAVFAWKKRKSSNDKPEDEKE